MVKFLAGRFLKTKDLATGGVNALHHSSDRAVLAGSVHRLEYDQYRVAIAGRQNALQFIEVARCFLPYDASSCGGGPRLLASCWRLLRESCHQTAQDTVTRVLQTSSVFSIYS